MEKIIITPEMILKAAIYVSKLQPVRADYYSQENADADLLVYLQTNDRLKHYTVEDINSNLQKIQFKVLRSRYYGNYWRLFFENEPPISLGELENLNSEWQFRYKIATALEEKSQAAKIYSQGYRLNECNKEIEEKTKEIIRLKKDLFAVRKGFKNFDSFKKIEKKLLIEKTASENNLTINQASAYLKAGKRYGNYMLQLFKNHSIHPNSYTGRGKHISKTADHAGNIKAILNEFSIQYISGNDAPKGGFCGDYIKLK